MKRFTEPALQYAECSPKWIAGCGGPRPLAV